MNILFIGNFQTGPGGERSDESHLLRELVKMGHQVYPVARDEWREYVIESLPSDKYKVPEPSELPKIDIAIIAKWHHFYDERFVVAIKSLYACPVFYWCWDNMEGHTPDDWHIKMAKTSDLYLSGELGLANHYRKNEVPFYYFQFDSCDGEDYTISRGIKEHDVIFTGSCTNQNGRLDILKEINKEVPIKVFGYDFEEWKKQGFDASPAVYGSAFNTLIAKSKIVLGTSAGPRIFGYWSNRVGKVLHAGGFLLQWYTPGMETIIGDSCEYFSSAQEAVEKIKYYLANEDERDKVVHRNKSMNVDRWTSEYKVKQLTILMERYLKEQKGELWMLP